MSYYYVNLQRITNNFKKLSWGLRQFVRNFVSCVFATYYHPGVTTITILSGICRRNSVCLSVFCRLCVCLSSVKSNHKIYIARSKADSVKFNLPHLAGKTFSGPGNREVRAGVIYNWKTMVEIICGKGTNLCKWCEKVCL